MGSMDIRFGADRTQTQVLSHRFRHAVQLLQMSSIEFAASVRDALGKNPFLEFEEGEGEDGPSLGPTQAAEDLPCDTGRPDSPEPESPQQADDRDLWQSDLGSSIGQDAGDDEISALDMMAVEPTLYSHLHDQLNLQSLSWRELVVARIVVESLDEDGYLRTPLDDLAGRNNLSDLDLPATLEELQLGLQRVQLLDPAGVGARSVAECLTLQLPGIGCPELRRLAGLIIGQHLPLLASRDAGGIARALSAAPDRVQAACDSIRRLQPRPGWRFGSSSAAHVVPDVTVRKLRGQWQVQLNPAIVPRVRLNQVYADLFERHRTAKDTAMAGHLQEARWTLRNAQRRFITIVEVAEAIVRHQRYFFDFGPMAMKPLGLKDIADEIGVHESTVSRVTSGKYMATPNGVYELKHFFSRAMVNGNGSACSSTAIRGLIKRMIEAESPVRPLSDVEIMRQLADQGLVVARRTVTKYRQVMRIAPVQQRRRRD